MPLKNDRKLLPPPPPVPFFFPPPWPLPGHVRPQNGGEGVNRCPSFSTGECMSVRHCHRSTQVCLKIELLSQTVSQPSLHVCMCVCSASVCASDSQPSQRSTKGADWCLPHGPGVFFFYFPLLSPGCGLQGPLTHTHTDKGVRRSLEGAVFRCVNTQPAIVWPEDRCNQYRGVTGGRAIHFAPEIMWSD